MSSILNSGPLLRFKVIKIYKTTSVIMILHNALVVGSTLCGTCSCVFEYFHYLYMNPYLLKFGYGSNLMCIIYLFTITLVLMDNTPEFKPCQNFDDLRFPHYFCKMYELFQTEHVVDFVYSSACYSANKRAQ